MTQTDNGNKYALHALRERRAEIAGEIASTEARLRNLREALAHIDGTLGLFSEGYDPKNGPVKKLYRRVKLFGQGNLNRMILTALREGARPMTTADVTASIVAALDYGPDAAKGMKPRVRSNLFYLWKVRGVIQKEGERETATWGLKG